MRIPSIVSRFEILWSLTADGCSWMRSSTGSYCIDLAVAIVSIQLSICKKMAREWGRCAVNSITVLSGPRAACVTRRR